MSEPVRSAVRGWDPEDPRHAAVAWGRMAEPGDLAAATLVADRGHVAALRWVLGGAGGNLEPPCEPWDPRVWHRARERWAPRLEVVRPERELAVVERLGGTVLTRQDPRWPRALADLGLGEPHCLWVRGDPDLPRRCRSGGVAIVGARASTAYGAHVASEFAAGVVAAGGVVVSGGAYGIDAVAHQAALARGGDTLAVMAGGLDRLYPAGNAELLDRVTREGAVVAELGPGSSPTRARFLTRNRLIAALAAACVVVEAGWRSGTLSTAGHAARLLRPVGAVPGPVTSAASAGCHRLLRDQAAICVTDVPEVMSLVESADATRPEAREQVSVSTVEPGAPQGDQVGPPPGLAARELAVWEALPARGSATPDALIRASGLAPREVNAALGRLELGGHLERDGARLRRSRRPRRSSAHGPVVD
ncbi:DNA-processing protein DprA [Serinibacter salmoneus]|uniref:DNA protecting protein DprA n=1 Tax=Serinibacter salmoneus TaxID=556530 RepID=A0A2A9CZ87_9MICO|nr:DNA-processing protein DprA [Serinibacter salmoneus]PFG19315.1 DNA protecting protein DprA [Serinibacter salmoneus]